MAKTISIGLMSILAGFILMAVNQLAYAGNVMSSSDQIAVLTRLL